MLIIDMSINLKLRTTILLKFKLSLQNIKTTIFLILNFLYLNRFLNLLLYKFIIINIHLNIILYLYFLIWIVQKWFIHFLLYRFKILIFIGKNFLIIVGEFFIVFSVFPFLFSVFIRFRRRISFSFEICLNLIQFLHKIVGIIVIFL